MRITSYNITDVAYHYVGLRVLAGAPRGSRGQQVQTISRNVLKYSRDKALRLMLPEPHGRFETVGEKVCQELVHFGFARPVSGEGYQLLEAGERVLGLLDAGRHGDLRREMARVHLGTYDNLRAILRKYVEVGSVLTPIVDVADLDNTEKLMRMLRPTFGDDAPANVREALRGLALPTAKKLEDALRRRILQSVFVDTKVSVPLFRSMNDRLVTLRLLNIMRETVDDSEFGKSYSPCAIDGPSREWHRPLEVPLADGDKFIIYLSEPNMQTPNMERKLLASMDKAFATLQSQAGYHDLPDVRDFCCEKLRIPEAAFDEGVNALLDSRPPKITLGLTYERISGRRKPLVRRRGSTQIFNLIRRA